MKFDLHGKRIFVAGHRGIVGSAIVRRLDAENWEVLMAQRSELDLLDEAVTPQWMQQLRPDVVVLAVAKVGGILAKDSFPADFFL
jgi:GDP-L-fucose synthase